MKADGTRECDHKWHSRWGAKERAAWNRFFECRNRLWLVYAQDLPLSKFVLSKCISSSTGKRMRRELGKSADEISADVTVVFWAVATAAARHNSPVGNHWTWVTKWATGLWSDWMIAEWQRPGGLTGLTQNEASLTHGLLSIDSQAPGQGDSEAEYEGTIRSQSWADRLATGGEDAMIALLDAKRARERSRMED